MSLYCVEHKTTSEDISLGADYWQKLVMDVQISMYIKGARSLGLPVDGVLYDVLYKPQLRPLKATPMESRKYTKDTGRLYANMRDLDETPEDYGRRVLASIVENPGKHYQRQVIVRLAQEELEADQDVWQTASNIRESRRLKMFPRNPDACMSWSRKCDYFSACTGITTIDDPLLFFKLDREHEELDGDTKALLTQSSLRSYRSCQRKFLYRYEMQMRPLVQKAETLRKGTSVHRALETWSKTGGDLEAAVSKLDREDPYAFEHEKAMMIGYHARWEHPGKVRAVERQFRMKLVNPETGAASKTFELGGKVDVIVEV